MFNIFSYLNFSGIIISVFVCVSSFFQYEMFKLHQELNTINVLLVKQTEVLVKQTEMLAQALDRLAHVEYKVHLLGEQIRTTNTAASVDNTNVLILISFIAVVGFVLFYFYGGNSDSKALAEAFQKQLENHHQTMSDTIHSTGEILIKNIQNLQPAHIESNFDLVLPHVSNQTLEYVANMPLF